MVGTRLHDFSEKGPEGLVRMIQGISVRLYLILVNRKVLLEQMVMRVMILYMVGVFITKTLRYIVARNGHLAIELVLGWCLTLII